jgi:hypothetical protein
MKKIIICIALLSVCITNQISAIVCHFGHGPMCPRGGHTCLIIHKFDGALMADLTSSSSNGLTATFINAEIPADYKKELSATYFIQETDMSIDDEVCTSLGISRGSKIAKGRYAIINNGKTLVINFGKPGSIFPAASVPAQKATPARTGYPNIEKK